MQIYSEKYSIVKNNNKAAPVGEVQAFHLNEVQAFHLNVHAFPCYFSSGTGNTLEMNK